MSQEQTKAPSQGLLKIKSFFQKAYYIALCGNDGKISAGKTIFAIGCVAYFAFINPLMLMAIAEIVIITSMILFLVQLFFSPNFLAKKETAAAAAA